jgi:SOS-response transcriptional repressor LexA
MSTAKTADMRDILQRLKLAKKFRTDKEVAEYLGVSAQAVSLWIKRNSKMPIEKILYRSRGEISERYLLTGEGPMQDHHHSISGVITGGSAKIVTHPAEPSNISSLDEPMSVCKVPVISWVQAGDWADSDCQTTPGYAEEYVYYPGIKVSPHIFALRIKNDSMEPEFLENDIVVVDPDKQAENGSYVIVKNGQEATFKKLILDGSRVYLKPLNRDYKPIDMTDKEFKIVGVVIYKVKKY